MDEHELKRRVEEADEVRRMMATEGWRIVSDNLRYQLEAYVADNASNATDWDDYLKKAGKIFGIRLLLADLDDYLRMGDEAREELG